MSNLVWDAQKLGGIGSTDTVASLAFFNDTNYIAWKGYGGDERCFFTFGIEVAGAPDTFPTFAWNTQAPIPDISSSVGPSIATATLGSPLIASERLYAVWKGRDTDVRIFISSFDTKRWTPQIAIPNFSTSGGPSLASDGSKLYMAWKGPASDQRCFYSTFDGTNWTPQAVIPGALSSVGPSLCATTGKLYAAWKGPDTEQNMWYSSLQAGNWAAKQPMPGLSSTGPSITKVSSLDRSGSTLVAAWKGQDGDDSVWNALLAGSEWLSPQQIPVARTNTRPALGSSGGFVTSLVWKQDTDGGLYSLSGSDLGRPPS